MLWPVDPRQLAAVFAEQRRGRAKQQEQSQTERGKSFGVSFHLTSISQGTWLFIRTVQATMLTL